MLQDIIVLTVMDTVHTLLHMDIRLNSIHHSLIHPIPMTLIHHTRLLVDIRLLAIHPTGAIPLPGTLLLGGILIHLAILTIHLPIIQALDQIWDY